MNRLRALGVALSLLAVTAPATAAGNAMISLETGKAHAIHAARPLARIVVTRPGIIDTRLTSASTLRITGRQPGETTVALYGDDGGLIASHDVRVAGAESALQRRLAEEPGLERLDVSRAGEGIILSGDVPDRASQARAGTIAKAWTGGNVTDLTAVTGQQMVAVDVQFAAVSSATLKALGFSFTKLGGSIQGALAPPNSVNGFTLPKGGSGLGLDAATPIQSAFNLFLSNPANGITGILSALSSTGLSEILAQPTLLVRSGDEASFLAGGEVPVPVPQGGGNANGIAIAYREFGVRLNVAADVRSDKRIVLKLTPEVSELDYANGVRMQGYLVPGLRRRSATTTVELGSGQSFAIAGLNYTSSGTTSENLPLLADLPVIGRLFRRTQKAGERQELVIIATPRLVDPLPPGQMPPLPGGLRAAAPSHGLIGR